MPTFHLSLQVMWWFGEEEQKEKSDTLLPTVPHSIVGFGIRGAGFGSYYLKILEKYTISKQSMTYKLCYKFPLSQKTKDLWLQNLENCACMVISKGATKVQNVMLIWMEKS
jgi:hypothetical protein